MSKLQAFLSACTYAGGVKTCQRVAEAAMAKLKLPPQVKAAMSEKLALLDI